MRWLLAPATFAALLLAIPSRAAGHAWLQNRPIDLTVAAILAAIVFLPAGLYLGWRKGRTVFGGASAATLGAAAAAITFITEPALGAAAVWAGWLAGWIGAGMLQSSLDGPVRAGKAVIKGIYAAGLGAVGFAIVQRQLLAAASPADLPIATNLIAWLVAYGPGFGVLTRR